LVGDVHNGVKFIRGTLTITMLERHSGTMLKSTTLMRSVSSTESTTRVDDHSFETRPGGSTRDLGLEPGRVEEKTGEGKTQCDPATRLTRQDPVANPLTFFKKNRLDDPVTRSKPGTRALNRARS